MNEGNYLMAWGFYILASFGAMLVFWRLVRFIPVQQLRNILQLLFATFLLVPWFIQPGSEYMAPAYVISAFEIIIKGQEPGVSIYVLVSMLLLVLAGGIGISIRDHLKGEKSRSYFVSLIDRNPKPKN